jgi:RimJ/RimL family protein N-acetyltransferase
MAGIAARESRDGETHGLVFRGHIRVREASAEEMKGFTGLLPDGERGRWVERALESRRTKVLVMENFEGRAWVPLGQAIVDAGGEMVVFLVPRFRGRGLCSAAIRAAVQNLRDQPLTVLTARVDEGDRAAAGAFERAGFVPSGRDASGDRPRVLYTFSMRGECMPFNVWI